MVSLSTQLTDTDTWESSSKSPFPSPTCTRSATPVSAVFQQALEFFLSFQLLMLSLCPDPHNFPLHPCSPGFHLFLINSFYLHCCEGSHPKANYALHQLDCLHQHWTKDASPQHHFPESSFSTTTCVPSTWLRDPAPCPVRLLTLWALAEHLYFSTLFHPSQHHPEKSSKTPTDPNHRNGPSWTSWVLCASHTVITGFLISLLHWKERHHAFLIVSLVLTWWTLNLKVYYNKCYYECQVRFSHWQALKISWGLAKSVIFFPRLSMARGACFSLARL